MPLSRECHIQYAVISHFSEQVKLIEFEIYSNKKETSDFHGTVSFDPAKMLQQK